MTDGVMGPLANMEVFLIVQIGKMLELLLQENQYIKKPNVCRREVGVVIVKPL